MPQRQPPTDGPHVPEKSAYYDELLEMMSKIKKCPDFTKEDCFFEHEVREADVFLYFSEKVVEEILKPTAREIPSSKKGNCPFYKALKKLSFQENGIVKVSCASDSIHAVYVLIAIYLSHNLPENKRKRVIEKIEQ